MSNVLQAIENDAEDFKEQQKEELENKNATIVES
jgi:hypothetical protein